MIPVNQIHPGMVVKLEGKFYIVISYIHVKPGKGGAFLRTKLRDIQTGNVVEKLLATDDKIEDIFVENKKLLYLYHDHTGYHFLDLESYEELLLSEECINEFKFYLKENMEVIAKVLDGKIVSIEMPNFVELKVISTEPVSRKDTAKPASKQAQLETGLVIQVPVFINVGDIVRIDTRNARYVERVE